MGTFASVLAELREARGLTKYRLAKRTGCSRSAVTRWEFGQRNPDAWTVRWLADALCLNSEERDRLFISAGHIPPDVPAAALLAACRTIREEATA